MVSYRFIVNYGFIVEADDHSEADEKVTKRLEEKFGKEIADKIKSEADSHEVAVDTW